MIQVIRSFFYPPASVCSLLGLFGAPVRLLLAWKSSPQVADFAGGKLRVHLLCRSTRLGPKGKGGPAGGEGGA